MRILVVEDDQAAMIYEQVVIRNVADTHGVRITVDAAIDGVKAVAMCRKSTYDVVLLDMMLPIIDGIQAARAMRTFGKSKTAVIIGCSAREDDPLYVAKALKAGVDFFAKKPLTKESVERFLGVASDAAVDE